ncbi:MULTISPECIES: WXG100 family type VII secretion target [Paenibacillus]|uniref:WXG100 family type VII secretion target n=1 Tax=Paenibacillus TaxID=44249 RepID=UPI0020415271|nr:WXG100 family type VII secretion target [Paenibacillus cellulositrophicus]MCM2997503.1 WXG100 family type VII secretion target [Paenibacillus cellulositrophicus]
MRISVEPESLRSLSRQLDRGSEQIREMTLALNQALGNFRGEAAFPQSVMDEWQSAHRQGEQIYAMLKDIGKWIESKASEFQTADEQHHSILNDTLMYSSPALMFQSAAVSGREPILPGYGLTDGTVSNPLSAVQAVHAEAGGSYSGWNSHGTAAAGAAAGLVTLMAGIVLPAAKDARLGLNKNEHAGSAKFLLERAANNPTAWRFIDPKAAGKIRTLGQGPGGHSGNEGPPGTGTKRELQQESGEEDRAPGHLMINNGIGLGAIAGSTAIGAAVGSVVPAAGTAVGAFVGLASSLVISAVTDIEVAGKTLRTHASGGMDLVSDSVKAVTQGASILADQVKDKLKSLGMRFA